MKVNKLGIRYRYFSDTITYVWPWKRKECNLGYTYLSSEYSFKFNSFKEYWSHSGAISERIRREGNITGHSIEEVLSSWVSSKFPFKHLVILWDIDYKAKPEQFWRTLPKTKIQAMSKDIVVFHCNDKTELYKIHDSIKADGLGECIMVIDGEIQSE